MTEGMVQTTGMVDSDAVQKIKTDTIDGIPFTESIQQNAKMDSSDAQR